MFDGVNDHHLTPCNCDAAGVRLVLRLHLRYRLQRRRESFSRLDHLYAFFKYHVNIYSADIFSSLPPGE